MADVTYALRQAALATMFENEVAGQINRSSPLLQLLPKIKADAKNVSWDVSFGDEVSTTAATADGADVEDAEVENDTKVPAMLPYCTYKGVFGVTGLAEAAAALAGNPSQLSNLMVEELGDTMTRLTATIGRDIYYGTGASNRMMGLIDPTNGAFIGTGTYATLARATYPQWAGNRISCNNGRITVPKVREMIRGIEDASGYTPDLFLATPMVFDQLADILGAQRRFVQSVNMPGRGEIKLDGGFTSIDFDGVPVFKDVRAKAATASASSGVFLGINTSVTRVRYMPNPSAASFIRQTGIATAIKGMSERQLKTEQTGLYGKIIELAKKGDKTRLGVYIYLQMQVRRCNANGFLADINETA